MEQTFIRGNRMGIAGLIFAVVLISSLCFTSYKAKKITELKKLDKELVAFELNLEKENQEEIKGYEH